LKGSEQVFKYYCTLTANKELQNEIDDNIMKSWRFIAMILKALLLSCFKQF